MSSIELTTSPDMANDYKNFPEHPLDGRSSFAMQHIPRSCSVLVDAGCSHGYATRIFSAKSSQTIAFDINSEAIAIAKVRYPDLTFFNTPLESLPLEDSIADCIICTDVIEHVDDEVAVFNEFFRILKPGGRAIITTPHKGLFSFLDSYNYQWYLRKYAYPLYKMAFRILKGGSPKPKDAAKGDYHRHYSLSDFERLLDQSHFKGKYAITAVHRGGLLLDPLSYNIAHAAHFFTPVPSAPLQALCRILHKEYTIDFGRLAYNIGIVIEKS